MSLHDTCWDMPRRNVSKNCFFRNLFVHSTAKRFSFFLFEEKKTENKHPPMQFCTNEWKSRVARISCISKHSLRSISQMKTSNQTTQEKLTPHISSSPHSIPLISHPRSPASPTQSHDLNQTSHSGRHHPGGKTSRSHNMEIKPGQARYRAPTYPMDGKSSPDMDCEFWF